MVKSSTTSITPALHAARHSVGGDDPLLTPVLVDPHHTTHESGGADEVAVTRAAHVVTGSRAENTNYQNTTGNEILVSIYATCNGGKAIMNLKVEDATPPTQIVDTAYGDVHNDKIAVNFLVPNNHYYKMETPTGAINAGFVWIEWY